MTDEIQAAKHAIQTVTVGETGMTLSDLATIFVKSGFFKDVREQAQAAVKVMLGQELGLKPIQAMMGIHIVEGKPEISAALMGALVKRSGRYDYRVKEHTDTACEIEFYSVVGPSGSGKLGESIGTSRFTMEDAARAGLANRNVWKSYPRNMMHARAMSNGVRWFCLDALGGLPVYTEGEISGEVAGNGIPARVIDKATGEVLDPPHEEENEYLPKEKTGVGGAIPPSPVDVPGTVVQRPDQAGDAQPAKRGPGRPRKTTDVAGSTPAGASTVAGFESPQGERGVDPAETAVSGAAGRAPISSNSAPEWIEFTLGEGTFMRSYRTRGMNAVQMAESHKLLKQVDTLCGKGTARAILAKQMNVQVEDATRNALTEAEADKFLAALRATLGDKA